jgi:hypothetical protein
MRHLIITLGFFVASQINAKAQSYSTAAGIRVGSGMGLSLQQSVGGKYTIEGILQQRFFSKNTTITGLIQQHHGLVGRGVNWYIGAGPHLGFYNTRSAQKLNAEQTTYGGISLIGGVEVNSGACFFLPITNPQ